MAGSGKGSFCPWGISPRRCPGSGFRGLSSLFCEWVILCDLLTGVPCMTGSPGTARCIIFISNSNQNLKEDHTSSHNSHLPDGELWAKPQHRGGVDQKFRVSAQGLEAVEGATLGWKLVVVVHRDLRSSLAAVSLHLWS